MSNLEDNMEDKFKKAAELVKWKRVNIAMATAIVTNNPQEAILIMERLKKAF